jgi:hypothetical protein
MFHGRGGNGHTGNGLIAKDMAVARGYGYTGIELRILFQLLRVSIAHRPEGAQFGKIAHQVFTPVTAADYGNINVSAIVHRFIATSTGFVIN